MGDFMMWLGIAIGATAANYYLWRWILSINQILENQRRQIDLLEQIVEIEELTTGKPEDAPHSGGL